MMCINRYLAWCVVLVVCGVDAASPVWAGASTVYQEKDLIAVLQSDAAPAEKAITCKRLSVYGTKDAVPALAPLLVDPNLASWARIALEVIPGPEADAALRQALDKAQGRLLIGVINSIGVRQDGQAVTGLAARLKDPEADVASAAAVALGRIGGEAASKALEQALAEAPTAVRPAAADGCLLCAERLLAEGRPAAARRLYDLVRRAILPKQKLLEATRGAILARGAAGVTLLVEQLESADKAQVGLGLRTARELPGRDVTEALAAELGRLSPDRQPLLLLALADRNDEAVLPLVVKAARSGSGKLRVTALNVLVRLGNASCVPVLLTAATEEAADMSQAARNTLAHLPGKDVDADLLARLPQATGKTRQVLIELAAQRQIEGALPAIRTGLQDTDAGVRAAAVQALGIMGESQQAAELVTLLQETSDSAARANIEKSLLAICGRWGAVCVPHLAPLMQSRDVALHTIGLHGMAVAGGSEALAAVRAAIADQDETIQDEAVRTLSTWPNNWPEDTAAAEALLTLAQSDKQTSHQVLALRGYLQFLRGDKKLNNKDKVTRIGELLPSLLRPEEKRLAIGVLGSMRTAASLELLTTLASDPVVAEDACSAIISLASAARLPGATREQRQKALETVVEKAKNGATKKKAEELLKGTR